MHPFVYLEESTYIWFLAGKRNERGIDAVEWNKNMYILSSRMNTPAERRSSHYVDECWCALLIECWSNCECSASCKMTCFSRAHFKRHLFDRWLFFFFCEFDCQENAKMHARRRRRRSSSSSSTISGNTFDQMSVVVDRERSFLSKD